MQYKSKLKWHFCKRTRNRVKELPYGEQSQIMYEDYNFDGKNDFAVMDGQNSCYHGPSFRIFLATGSGFEESPEFTALAQEYCGMFNIDPKEMKISTMTKSGCCWHQFSEFIVEDNMPKVIKIVEDNQSDYPYSVYSEEIWDGQKMARTETRTVNLDDEGIKVVLAFEVQAKHKKIVLFNINDRTLNYALINEKDEVELAYPIETVYQNPDFTFDTKKNTLSFKNKDTSYTVYADTDKTGIEINIDGKKYTWKGNAKTRQGNLSRLLTTRLDNVVIN